MNLIILCIRLIQVPKNSWPLQFISIIFSIIFLLLLSVLKVNISDKYQVTINCMHCSKTAVYLQTQQEDVGSNPVQVETGEFDEAIEVVEDIAAESK